MVQLAQETALLQYRVGLQRTDFLDMSESLFMLAESDPFSDLEIGLVKRRHGSLARLRLLQLDETRPTQDPSKY